MAFTAYKNAQGTLNVILDMEQPFPLLSVMEHLAEGVEHLLGDHSCDRHGHKVLRRAVTRAREWQVVVMARLQEDHDREQAVLRETYGKQKNLVPQTCTRDHMCATEGEGPCNGFPRESSEDELEPYGAEFA